MLGLSLGLLLARLLASEVNVFRFIFKEFMENSLTGPIESDFLIVIFLREIEFEVPERLNLTCFDSGDFSSLKEIIKQNLTLKLYLSSFYHLWVSELS